MRARLQDRHYPGGLQHIRRSVTTRRPHQPNFPLFVVSVLPSGPILRPHSLAAPCLSVVVSPPLVQLTALSIKMRFIPTLALAVLSATASARVIERNTFGGEAEGDARFATQALTHGIRSHLELQRGEETSLAKIEEMVSGEQANMTAFCSRAVVVAGLGLLTSRSCSDSTRSNGRSCTCYGPLRRCKRPRQHRGAATRT